ncbi:hypothetical protein [Candidatus Palauibacter sp.]|uniref:hypothetical protein n=1 Tax=Candidatus Palauibacter sp. TaxID=3101350 RepID=UPI003CC58BEF
MTSPKSEFQFSSPLAGWCLNEYDKRRWERRKSKEGRYISLLENCVGFYDSTGEQDSQDYKNKFLEEVRVVWLSCPDEIIRSAYGFLDQVKKTDGEKSKESDPMALGALVLQMRKDMLGKKFFVRSHTGLEAKDYQHLSST